MADPKDTQVTLVAPASAPTKPAPSTCARKQEPKQQQEQQQSTQPPPPLQKQPQAKQQTPVNDKLVNGQSIPVKQQKVKETGPENPLSAPDQPVELSNAEKKKLAKAEKARRREKQKLERDQAANAVATHHGQGQPPTAVKKAGGGKDPGSAQKGQKQTGGVGGAPLGRGSAQTSVTVIADIKKKEDKNVAVFGHLYGQPRRAASKEVHPAVLALGLQIRDYVICGSSARCVATLLAFKRMIESYTTPLGTSLARHLMIHLSHQITYLSTCRPLSISQGNAIRALKLCISSIDPSTPEAESKASLCEFIDSFIRERITVADEVIASSAAQKIQDGDVIVTFAGSSIVKKTLFNAHKQNKKFRVFIIDSRPLFEGKNLARALANAGLEVQYSLINGISHAIKDATKVFLGAHAMTGNGRLYSRVGTALVAMSAKERSGGVEVPVIVCCETVKFTDRVALDSIVVNEIADADELVPTQSLEQITGLPVLKSPSPDHSHNSKSAGSTVTETLSNLSFYQSPASPLKDWKDTPNLQLLNIMYDVTPAEYVDLVITEMGSLPPSAVPIVHRMSTNS